MILKVKGLKFSYPSNEVLNGLEFTTKRGEIVVILGPNGTGKTTLLKCINRILKPSMGAIYIDSKEIENLKRKDIARKVGYVEQQRVGSKSTVFDAVLLGRKPYIKWDVRADDIKIVEKALRDLGISDYAFKHLDELSGGELQKVIIARAIAQEPDILLMDEPTNHLDPKNQIGVLNIVKRIAREKDISIITTMHDINLALKYGDSFLLLKDKSIYRAGGEEIIEADIIKDVYSVSVDIIKYKNKKVVILDEEG